MLCAYLSLIEHRCIIILNFIDSGCIFDISKGLSMKKELILILFIGSVFSGSIFAQENKDRADKNRAKLTSAYNCNRIRIDTNRVEGTRTLSTPIDANGTYNSRSTPTICFSKVIDSSGREKYFLLFKVYCGKFIPWEKDINSNVIFKDGTQIEKHSDSDFNMAPFNSSYDVRMPLDSSDLAVFRKSAIKKIVFMDFELTDFGLTEYFFYYLDCLFEKK